jgi:hypothetical protein
VGLQAVGPLDPQVLRRLLGLLGVGPPGRVVLETLGVEVPAEMPGRLSLGDGTALLHGTTMVRTVVDGLPTGRVLALLEEGNREGGTTPAARAPQTPDEAGTPWTSVSEATWDVPLPTARRNVRGATLKASAHEIRIRGRLGDLGGALKAVADLCDDFPDIEARIKIVPY